MSINESVIFAAVIVSSVLFMDIKDAGREEAVWKPSFM